MEKIKKHQARTEQSYNQQIVRLENFLRELTSATIRHQQIVAESRHNEKISDTASNLDLSLNVGSTSLGLGHHTSHVVAEKAVCLSRWQQASQQCKCCCHQRYSNRSSRFVDGIIGTFFAGYCGIPYLALECTVRSCTQTCLISDSLLTITYFFPTWLLSCAFTFVFKMSTLGFDYTFRFANCVSYSSPIFQCAYQGDIEGIKVILRSKLGSPFDVTTEPQRSLLGVYNSSSCLCLR